MTGFCTQSRKKEGSFWQQDSSKSKGCVPAVVGCGHGDTGESFLFCWCELFRPRPKVSNCRLLIVGKALGEPMAWRIRLRLRSVARTKSHGCGQYGNWHLCVCLQTQRQCLARRTQAWVGVIDLCVLKGTPLPSPKIPAPELFPLGLPGRREAGGSFLRARHLWTEDMAGLGSPAFQQLPKYVDSSVDSRSRHVPRARTKENVECFLDDTAFIQSHAFLWEGGEEGSWLSAGAGALLWHAQSCL